MQTNNPSMKGQVKLEILSSDCFFQGVGDDLLVPVHGYVDDQPHHQNHQQDSSQEAERLQAHKITVIVLLTS